MGLLGAMQKWCLGLTLYRALRRSRFENLDIRGPIGQGPLRSVCICGQNVARRR